MTSFFTLLVVFICPGYVSIPTLTHTQTNYHQPHFTDGKLRSLSWTGKLPFKQRSLWPQHPCVPDHPSRPSCFVWENIVRICTSREHWGRGKERGRKEGEGWAPVRRRLDTGIWERRAGSLFFNTELKSGVKPWRKDGNVAWETQKPKEAVDLGKLTKKNRKRKPSSGGPKFTLPSRLSPPRVHHILTFLPSTSDT